jgi:hypothetical protein
MKHYDFTYVSQDSNNFPRPLALSLWMKQLENLYAQHVNTK